MRDKTANVEMQSENSIATSGAAAKLSAGQLEVPTIEFPTNLRELAEEAVVQTRENYERIETAANAMLSVLVNTQSAAAKSVVYYRAWLIRVSHGNIIAAFDFAHSLGAAKTVFDVVQLSSAHSRATRCFRRADKGADRALAQDRGGDGRAGQHDPRQRTQGRSLISHGNQGNGSEPLNVWELFRKVLEP